MSCCLRLESSRYLLLLFFQTSLKTLPSTWQAAEAVIVVVVVDLAPEQARGASMLGTSTGTILVKRCLRFGTTTRKDTTAAM